MSNWNRFFLSQSVPSDRSAPLCGKPNVTMLLPIGLAAVLSFYSLGTKGLWLDEAGSIALARLSWLHMWRVIRTDEINMIAYHVPLHFWLSLAPVSLRSGPYRQSSRP